MALKVFRSESFEILRELLVNNLEESFKDSLPFDDVTVITPSSGMQDYLKKRFADAYKTDAGVRFDYLARWIWEVLHEGGGEFGQMDALDADVMAWRIDAYFGDASFTGAHPRLRSALAGLDRFGRHDLARRAAAVLSRYNTYRADWVLAWVSGGDPEARGAEEPLLGHPDYGWQKALWEMLARDFGLPKKHPGELLREHPERFSKGRVHIFLPTDVAPVYLKLLYLLSRIKDVWVYLETPSRAYWFDMKKGSSAPADAHPLLAAWGAQARSAGEQFEELSEDAPGVLMKDLWLDPKGEEPLGDTNLAKLHYSLFTADRGAARSMRAPDISDRTLEIHGAHSLRREIEVLTDYLYEIFKSDPETNADDVLVLVPDIEAAAPLFLSVFDALPENRRIPWRATGRAERSQNAAADLLCGLFEAMRLGFRASGVFSILANPLVRERFAIAEGDILGLKDIFASSGYRLGLSSEERANEGITASSAYTLKEALCRVMYRYAMPEDYFLEENGLSPLGALPEKNLVSVFASFASSVEKAFQSSRGEKTAQEWAEWAKSVLADFAGSDAFEREDALIVCQKLSEITRAVQASGTQDIVMPAEVFMDEVSRSVAGFVRGAKVSPGVTVAPLGSLRPISFKVVAVLGLNDGAFPKRQFREDFDLMGAFPRKWDANRPSDDRSVFLDAVLAASNYLYLSYTSRSMSDGSELCPSPVIGELLDFLSSAVPGFEPGDWLIEHPIHAFSLESFSGKDRRTCSHDEELARAIRESLGAVREEHLDLDAPSEIPQEALLADIGDFWEKPLKVYWKRRLGLAEPQDMAELEDSLPYDLDNLESWALGKDILDWYEERNFAPDPEEARAFRQSLLTRPGMPPGICAEKALGEKWANGELLARSFREKIMAPKDILIDRRCETSLSDGSSRAVQVRGAVRQGLAIGPASGQNAVPVLFEVLGKKAGPAQMLAVLSKAVFAGREPFYLFAPGERWKVLGMKDMACFFDFPEDADMEGLRKFFLRYYLESFERPISFFPEKVWAEAFGDGRFDADETKKRMTNYSPHLFRLSGGGAPEEFMAEMIETGAGLGKELKALLGKEA